MAYRADTLSRQFSGIVLNQNAAHTAYLSTLTTKYQIFRLPADYMRAGITPPLTGFQICVSATSEDVEVEWTLERRTLFSSTWDVLASGVATGVPAEGDEVWLTCTTESPVSVESGLNDQYRFSVTPIAGVERFWYTSPNPLTFGEAYDDDPDNPMLDGGEECSFLFRVLAGVADSGTDWLGNAYRSVVIKKSAASADPSAGTGSYWLSAPQPSQFAVVSRYFDMRDAFGQPQMIDSVLLDPNTPGVWAHLYYSDEGEPGTDETSWEERVWTPVPKSYRMTTRNTFVLPSPVKAKYIKVEFSHLQARSYSPGPFQKPVVYKKHPKWVLDYFLLITADARPADSAAFVANAKRVTYNAYDLAYNYYQDDLFQSPDGPGFTSPADAERVQKFLASKDDYSDLVDPVTQSLISTTLRPFLIEPHVRHTARNLLGEVALNSLVSQTGTYPVETLPPATSVGPDVSSLNREAVIFEQHFPVMYFYIAARHRYREVAARLDKDRAYFVGLNEIAFLRSNYSVESDADMYVELMGDFANAERNDFIVGDPPVVNT